MGPAVVAASSSGGLLPHSGLPRWLWYFTGMDDPAAMRRHHRRSVEVSFRVRDAGDPSQGDILFDTVDLSQGGAFLRSDLLLEVGEIVDVTFGLPGEIRPIRARARVAWATRKQPNKGGPGMGLQFIELAEKDREAIAAFVRSAR
jgi:uncharacterized protein (TIGR02266 family)